MPQNKLILNSNSPVKSPQYGWNKNGSYFDDFNTIQKCINFEDIKSLSVSEIYISWNASVDAVKFTYWVETEGNYYLVEGKMAGSPAGNEQSFKLDNSERITNIEVGVNSSYIGSLNFTTHNFLTKERKNYSAIGSTQCGAIYQLSLEDKNKDFLCFFGSGNSWLCSIGIYMCDEQTKQEMYNKAGCLKSFLSFPSINYNFKRKDNKRQAIQGLSKDGYKKISEKEEVTELEAIVEVPVVKD